ncbi:hypothetical protein D3C81_712440 [compost metagenome]
MSFGNGVGGVMASALPDGRNWQYGLAMTALAMRPSSAISAGPRKRTTASHRAALSLRKSDTGSTAMLQIPADLDGPLVRL